LKFSGRFKISVPKNGENNSERTKKYILNFMSTMSTFFVLVDLMIKIWLGFLDMNNGFLSQIENTQDPTKKYADVWWNNFFQRMRLRLSTWDRPKYHSNDTCKFANVQIYNVAFSKLSFLCLMLYGNMFMIWNKFFFVKSLKNISTKRMPNGLI